MPTPRKALVSLVFSFNRKPMLSLAIFCFRKAFCLKLIFIWANFMSIGVIGLKVDC